MFRTNIAILLSLFCLFAHANLFAQDNVLLTELDLSGGYGIRLLHNDVNTDLLLLCVFDPFEEGGFVYNTKVRAIHLQREGSGAYAPVRDRAIFETSTMIPQLDWVYDPISQTYLVAMVNGEKFGSDRDIRLFRLDLKGKLIGSVMKLKTQDFEVNNPQLCIVPKGTLNAPAQARFLFVGRGGDPMSGDSGVVSVFLDANADSLGKLEFAVKELESGGKDRYDPEDLVPSGDKKGFLLACEFRDQSEDAYSPIVIRLTGNAKYSKKISLVDSDPVTGSIGLFKTSKKKFAATWVDQETLRYWSSTFPGKLRKPGTPKLIGEQPLCDSDTDLPYTVLCKPDKAKKAAVFFVGDASDRRIFTALMKKTGKTSGHEEMTMWSTSKLNFFFTRSFDVAPIKGTDSILCVIALREGPINVIGTIIRAD